MGCLSAVSMLVGLALVVIAAAFLTPHIPLASRPFAESVSFLYFLGGALFAFGMVGLRTSSGK